MTHVREGYNIRFTRKISLLMVRNILPAIASDEREPFDDNVIINYTRELPSFPPTKLQNRSLSGSLALYR